MGFFCTGNNENLLNYKFGRNCYTPISCVTSCAQVAVKAVDFPLVRLLGVSLFVARLKNPAGMRRVGKIFSTATEFVSSSGPSCDKTKRAFGDRPEVNTTQLGFERHASSEPRTYLSLGHGVRLLLMESTRR